MGTDRQGVVAGAREQTAEKVKCLRRWKEEGGGIHWVVEANKENEAIGWLVAVYMMRAGAGRAGVLCLHGCSALSLKFPIGFAQAAFYLPFSAIYSTFYRPQV